MSSYELGEIEDRVDEHLIIGVDEVGVGALAGPLGAGAVVLDLLLPTLGINDSKKVAEAKRVRMAGWIKENAIFQATAMVHHKELDRIGVARASNLAKLRAVLFVLEAMDLDESCTAPPLIVVDGNDRITGSPLLRGIEQWTFPKGDQRSWSVAAGSILAKVERDAFLYAAHKKWPGYGFDRNHGYGTQEHMQKLVALGPCPIHRRCMRPVRDLDGGR